jgi:hypothetical protein
MTLAALRALSKVLYYTATQKSDIDDNQWLLLLNSAQRTIFLDIERLYPEWFAERSSNLTITPPADNVTFATIAPSGQPIHRVLDVKAAAGITAVPRTPLRALERPLEGMAYDPGGTSPIIPARWWVEGGPAPTLYTTPVASAAFRVIVTFNRVPLDMAADTDTPLLNVMQSHHDKIALLSAKLAAEKDGSPYDAYFKYVRGVLLSQLSENPGYTGTKPPQQYVPQGFSPTGYPPLSSER